MKTKLILLLLLTACSQDDTRWQPRPVLHADIDCDGVQEAIYLGFIEQDFRVKLTPSSTGDELVLQFGLAQPERQDAICGDKPEFTAYPANAEAQLDLFGEVFEGYRSGPQCFDLAITDGMCDSINIFYNHQTQTLNWWRL